jgi:F-type H+-transporting ATPase subunit b
MQRGWLLLGLGALLVALFAATVSADDKDKDHSEESKKKLEEVRTLVNSDAEPTDIFEKVKKLLEEKPKEPSIFEGFLDLSIWSIVVFLVLYFVLKKYAWGPMLQGLDNREKRIQAELDQAQKANADAQTLKSDFEKRINEAHLQARAVIDEARKNAEELMAEMTNKARSEIQADRDRLRRELDTAKEQAIVELFQRTTQLASLVSSKAIRRQMTIEDQHRLVDEALNDMGAAANERQRVLATIQ